MKQCGEIRGVISQYIDEELDKKQLAEFEKHINSCEECRNELEEIKNIIDMCRCIEDEDLPDNFEEELHLKLMAVKEESKYTNKIVKLRKQYVKIISTVAACLLLAFLIKGLFYGDYFPKSADDKSTENMSAAEMAVPESKAEITSDAKADAAEDSIALQNGENESSLDGEFSIQEKEQEKLSGAVSRSTPPEERSQALQKTAEENVYNNSAFIIVKLNGSLDTGIEETSKTALDNGAEFLDQNIGYTLAEAPQDAQEESTETVLNFKIPNNQYQNFLDSLAKSIGQDNITVQMNSEDMNSVMDFYDKKLDEIESNINKKVKSKNASNPEELDDLKDERQNIINEIERIKLDSDYTFVTIYVQIGD